MRDARTAIVLLAAGAVVAALFAPWYALDFGGAAREAMLQGTGQLPGPLGDFARGLLTVLPERLVVNGWQIFERTDVVLLSCALGAAFAALLSRFDVAALAGGAAGAMTLVEMLDQPGPGGDIVSLQWGPWLALAGAVTIVAASLSGPRARVAPAPPTHDTPAGPPADARPVAATVWPPV
ncbi:MAG: hypothetical protein Q8K79_08555 [Solirubrobacteraceae bacterium]|nr:hypothetical protein [Solirubrobacteraceae bacterium]